MNATEPRVRIATASDVELLLPLVREYWRFEGIEHYEHASVAAALHSLLAREDLGAGWLAFESGVPSGYLLAVFSFSLEYGGRIAEIDEFFVSGSERGRGVGKALLRTAEAAFSRCGCVRVALQLGVGNVGARSFYLRHGYDERRGYQLLDKVLRHAG